MSLKIIFVYILVIWRTNAANHTVLELTTAEFKPNFNLLTDIVPFAYNIHLTIETDGDDNFNVYSGTIDIDFLSNFDRDVLQFMAHGLNFTEIRLRNFQTNKTIRNFNTVRTMLNHVSTDDIYLFRDDGEVFLTGDTYYNLAFEYTGRIKQSGDKTGLFQSKFVEDDRVSKFVATHFQTKFIRDVIPTFEDISFKPGYNLKISHHPKFIALSNMPGTVTNHSANLATTTFESTPLMSGYLLAFAVGQFTKTFVYNYNRHPFNIYGSSRIMNDFDIVNLESGRILKKFEEYLGLQYRLPKLDFLVLPEYEFAGMENWGLIVFKEAELYGAPNSPNVMDDNAKLALIAHELAHQFFGNVLTPKEWRYVWLSEGFATYLSYKILDSLYRNERFEESFIFNNLYEVFKIDTGKLYLNQQTPKNSIHDVKNKLNYCKASAVIRMINHVVGDEIFAKFLKKYVQYPSSVEPVFMIRLLESQITLYSDQQPISIRNFIESWIDQKGSVIVTAIRNYSIGNVQLTQEFNTRNRNSPRNTTWWIPYNYATKNNRSWNTSPTGWLRNVPSDTLNMNLPATDWIIFNNQHTGVYIMNYDTTNWGLILNELNYGDAYKIHSINRAQILHDLNKLVEYGKVNRLVLLRALFYLRHEIEYLPWKIGSKILEKIFVGVKDTPQVKHFNDMIALLITRIYTERQIQYQHGDAKIVKQIRKIVLRWALQISYLPCLTDIENLSNLYLNSIDGDSRMFIEPEIITDMFCHGFQQRENWENITDFFENHQNHRDILTYLRTIHCKPYTLMFRRNFMIYQYGLNGSDDRPKVQKAAIDHSIKQVDSKNYLTIVYECLIENCYDFHQHYDTDTKNQVISNMLTELISYATPIDLPLIKQILLKIEVLYSINSLKMFNAALSSSLDAERWFRMY